ncbi:MAG: M1 family metallopeptidase [bacterium]|nr:M1 family metallopeptidase [bacterium]
MEVTASIRLGPDDDASITRLSIPAAEDMVVHEVLDAGGGELSWALSPEGTILSLTDNDRSDRISSIHLRYTLPVTLDEKLGYYQLCEPTGQRWFPKPMTEEGKPYPWGDYRVTLDFPEDMGLLTSGGYQVPDRDDGRSQTTYSVQWVQDFGIVAAEGFVVEVFDDGALPVHAFYQQEYREEFTLVVRRTQEAISWYLNTYGFFPQTHMGVIQGHPQWGGGFPLTNMFMVHLANLSDDFLSFITAHELGHYYWGLHVLSDSDLYLDWLMLANGIWIDQLYLSQRNERTLPQQWRASGNGDWFLDYFKALVSNYDQRLDLTDEEVLEIGLDYDYNSLIRHGKGATGVLLQSQIIGTEAFLAMQKRILAEFTHSPLSVSEFVDRLMAAGAEDAAEFFAVWRRSDARLDAVIDLVEPAAAGGCNLVVRRTGNVPYPIDGIVDLGAAGIREFRLEADASIDTLHLAVMPASFGLDPDGILPISGSMHSDQRALWLTALYRQKRDDLFIPLAQAHLKHNENQGLISYYLARRLYWLGRYEEVTALLDGNRAIPGIRDQYHCLATIYTARALNKLGRQHAASDLLDTIAGDALRNDLESFYKRIRLEITSPPSR